jgi:sporulation protein YlmC with PRC-barrel domain
MRLEALRNRAVVDPETGSRIGTVTDYWIDPGSGRVAVLIIRPVDADLSQRVAAERVARVGRDAIMLSRSNGTNTAASASTTARSDWLDRHHISGLAVYTDTGDRLGRIDGAEIDPQTLAIEKYDLAIPVWRRWLSARQQIEASAVAWCGRDVLVVRTDDVVKLRPAGHEDGTYAPVDEMARNGAPQPPGRNRSVPA